VFDAWVQTVKFGKVVQRRIAVSVHQPFERLFHLDDVNEIAVLGELPPFQQDLDLEMVGMPLVLRTTVWNGQVVLGHEVAANHQLIHRTLMSVVGRKS